MVSSGTNIDKNMHMPMILRKKEKMSSKKEKKMFSFQKNMYASAIIRNKKD